MIAPQTFFNRILIFSITQLFNIETSIYKTIAIVIPEKPKQIIETTAAITNTKRNSFPFHAIDLIFSDIKRISDTSRREEPIAVKEAKKSR